MTHEFKPVVYLKDGCPFSFKLRVALLEMGLLDKVQIQTFSTGTPAEAEIRHRLSVKIEKVSFPTVEISPGEFKGESDALIAYFGHKYRIALENLTTLSAYVEGPFNKIMRLSKENRELKKAATNSYG